VSTTALADAQPQVTQQSQVTQQEACPLCGASLGPDQDWCLSCGTGARTRLAAQPKWKALVIALLLIVVLSLGVLAAALVKLAG
jgi:hypothetical protein